MVQQIDQILKDTSLVFDRKKIFLFGRSAGGNLVPAAAQDPILRGLIARVIGLYAVTDASIAISAKMAAKPDTTIPDMLESGYTDLMELYLGAKEAKDAKSRDVRASPGLFWERENLPEHIYLIGGEHYLLCAEALDMAKRLAGGPGKGADWGRVASGNCQVEADERPRAWL